MSGERERLAGLRAAVEAGFEHWFACRAMLPTRHPERGDGSCDCDRLKRIAALDAYTAALSQAGEPGREAPYDAVSVNGRAMEWKGPLWDAINSRDWKSDTSHAAGRVRAVVQVERAVEIAMRVAVECAASSGATREGLGEQDRYLLAWAVDGLEIAQHDPLGPYDDVDQKRIARLREIADATPTEPPNA